MTDVMYRSNSLSDSNFTKTSINQNQICYLPIVHPHHLFEITKNIFQVYLITINNNNINSTWLLRLSTATDHTLNNQMQMLINPLMSYISLSAVSHYLTIKMWQMIFDEVVHQAIKIKS